MSAKSKVPFRLIQDDDGHWYIIPVDKVEEFYAYMKNEYAYWPAWIEEVDGPHRVTFEEYNIIIE